MKSVCAYSLAALLICSSSLASAHHPDGQAGDVEYARVLSADPIYKTSEYSQSREECWNGQAPGSTQSHNDTDKLSGARAGHDASQPNPGSYRLAAYHGERICAAEADRASGEEVIAYRVRYRYQGHDYVTEMPYDPGSRLLADVDVQPIRW